MSKKSICLNVIFIITFSTILTFGLVESFQDAEALKSKGTYLPKYGSATKGIVCGDKLCSEISNKVSSLHGIDDISPQNLRTITEKVFIYAYPMLENYKTMYNAAVDESSKLYAAPFNVIHHNEGLSSPDDTWVTTPNSDTIYSRAWLDLRLEPVILTIPEIEEDRYYTFQLTDFHTNNFGYLGTRTTGNDGGVFMIAGPSWNGNVPNDVEQVHKSETDIVIILGRTQVKTPDDVQNALNIMQKYDLKTLSEYLGETQPEIVPTIDFIPWDAQKAYTGEFVNYVNLILTWSPIHPSEKQLYDEFSKIGISPGKIVEFDDSQQMIIDDAVSSAYDTIRKNILEQPFKNGWFVPQFFGDREFHGTNFLNRSTGALYGLYGNTIEEALYIGALVDDEKNILDGSKNNYLIKFSAEPPVDAFWSVTMYDQENRLLVENSIDRYLINSISNLQKNDDGSFVIYVQHDSPSEDQQSNWLPAPDGPIYMVYRMYLGDETIINRTFDPPVIEKIE
jgi:hypothetical protein